VTGFLNGTSRPYPSHVAAQWTTSDAWVFSSIEGTSPDDGYTLAQIIAKADGINHAILTESEFVRAVPRLLAAGLIGASGGANRATGTLRRDKHCIADGCNTVAYSAGST
jgi:hypothetical protein